jgi:DNA-binding NarL/FixJ family response regulator
MKVFERLTKRELDVLRLMAKGMKNREIAQTLFLSEATVENHLHRIFGKLNVKTRTQAAIKAVRDGLVEAHEI